MQFIVHAVDLVFGARFGKRLFLDAFDVPVIVMRQFTGAECCHHSQAPHPFEAQTAQNVSNRTKRIKVHEMHDLHALIRIQSSLDPIPLTRYKFSKQI